jgi:hypothetical protein
MILCWFHAEIRSTRVLSNYKPESGLETAIWLDYWAQVRPDCPRRDRSPATESVMAAEQKSALAGVVTIRRQHVFSFLELPDGI